MKKTKFQDEKKPYFLMLAFFFIILIGLLIVASRNSKTNEEIIIPVGLEDQDVIVQYKNPSDSVKNLTNPNEQINEKKSDSEELAGEFGEQNNQNNIFLTPENDKKILDTDKPTYVGNEIIVKYKDEKNKKSISAIKESKQLKDKVYKVKLKDAKDLQNVINDLNKDPAVEYAEPNYIYKTFYTPNDTNYTKQWALNNTGQTGGTNDADIDAPEAWDIEKGKNDVVVAVIDTGVDYNHPDLSDSILKDTNGNIVGWDFENNDNNPMDDIGHGTHVAGIIAASSNNGKGVSGVCHNCKIMPIKFLGLSVNSGSADGGYLAIKFAIDNGADIINNSWGGWGYSQLLDDVITEAYSKGIIVVSSAGNDNLLLPNYPAALKDSLSVAATGNNNKRSSYSTFGGNVDISAPGGEINNKPGCRTDYNFSILSTLPSNGPIWNSLPASCKFQDSNGTYGAISGTSMAGPQVAGAFGLLKSNHLDWTAKELIEHLLSTTDNIYTANPEYKSYLGSGLLNINNALSQATKQNAFKGVAWVNTYDHFYQNVGEPKRANLGLEDQEGFYLKEYARLGETLYFNPVLKNYAGPLRSLDAKLTSLTPCITVTQNHINLPNVTGWQEFKLPQKFEVKIGNNCEYESIGELKFTIVDEANNILLDRNIVINIGYKFFITYDSQTDIQDKPVNGLLSNKGYKLGFYLENYFGEDIPGNTYRARMLSSTPCVTIPSNIQNIPGFLNGQPNPKLTFVVNIGDCSNSKDISIRLQIIDASNKVLKTFFYKTIVDSVSEAWLVQPTSPVANQVSRVADMNNDNSNELINVTFAGLNGVTGVSLLDANGNIKEGWPFAYLSYFRNLTGELYSLSQDSIVIGNIDYDKEKEIIFSGLINSFEGNEGEPYQVVMAVNHDGTVVPGFPYFIRYKQTDVKAYIHTSFILADVDEDGIDEILFTKYGSHDFTDHVINTTLRMLDYKAGKVEAYDFSMALKHATYLAAANVDQDNAVEIIGKLHDPTNKKTKVYKYDFSGGSFTETLIMETLDYNIAGGHNTLVITDLDNNNVPEIVFDYGSNQIQECTNNLGCTMSEDQMVTVVNPNGSVVAGWPQLGYDPIPTDLNKDGIGEIAVTKYEFTPSGELPQYVTQNESRVLYSRTGQVVWEKSFGALKLMANYAESYKSFNLSNDLDGDNLPDLFANSFSGFEFDRSVYNHVNSSRSLTIKSDGSIYTYDPLKIGMERPFTQIPVIDRLSGSKNDFIFTAGSFNHYSVLFPVKSSGIPTTQTYWNTYRGNNRSTRSMHKLPVITNRFDLASEVTANPNIIDKGGDAKFDVWVNSVSFGTTVASATVEITLSEDVVPVVESIDKKDATCAVNKKVVCTIPGIVSGDRIKIRLSINSNNVASSDQVWLEAKIVTSVPEADSTNNTAKNTIYFSFANIPNFQISPSGNISTDLPTYKWNHIPGIDFYDFESKDLDKAWQYHTRNFFTNEVCTGNICEYKPPYFSLISGDNYEWSIRGRDFESGRLTNTYKTQFRHQ